jgi:preprotein translocase subunit SecG
MMNEMTIGMATLFLFFTMVFGLASFDASMKYDCRKEAIQKNLSASDIQAICK